MLKAFFDGAVMGLVIFLMIASFLQAVTLASFSKAIAGNELRMIQVQDYVARYDDRVQRLEVETQDLHEQLRRFTGAADQ